MPAAVFAPDGDLKLREIPIAFQMPDWNHWLPQVHPLDAWGERFAASQLSRMYATLEQRRNSCGDARELLCQLAQGAVEVPGPAAGWAIRRDGRLG